MSSSFYTSYAARQFTLSTVISVTQKCINEMVDIGWPGFESDQDCTLTHMALRVIVRVPSLLSFMRLPIRDAQRIVLAISNAHIDGMIQTDTRVKWEAWTLGCVADLLKDALANGDRSFFAMETALFKSATPAASSLLDEHTQATLPNGVCLELPSLDDENDETSLFFTTNVSPSS